MKYTAQVRVGAKTFKATATADSALEAKHKIAAAALSANPGKDIIVNDIRLEESPFLAFFSKLSKQKK